MTRPALNLWLLQCSEGPKVRSVAIRPFEMLQDGLTAEMRKLHRSVLRLGQCPEWAVRNAPRVVAHTNWSWRTSVTLDTNPAVNAHQIFLEAQLGS